MWFDHREELGDVVDMDELLSRCMGNLDFAERVLCMLQDRCTSDIEELQQAVDQQDAEKVASIAHRLKGAYANAAAANLKTRAAELEDSARRKDLSNIQSNWRSLHDKWNEFSDAISKSDSVGELPAVK